MHSHYVIKKRRPYLHDILQHVDGVRRDVEEQLLRGGEDEIGALAACQPLPFLRYRGIPTTINLVQVLRTCRQSTADWNSGITQDILENGGTPSMNNHTNLHMCQDAPNLLVKFWLPCFLYFFNFIKCALTPNKIRARIIK